MRRVVVLGGAGLFGGAAVELLRRHGVDPVALDAVEPFQDRSTALVETAADVGADVVDISDGLVAEFRQVGVALCSRAPGGEWFIR